MKSLAIGEHLVIDPQICHGKLTFKGTRLPVQTVLSLLSKQRRSIDYILKSWPQLKKEAIEEAIRLAVAGWPELLQDDVGNALRELAQSLKAESLHEPVHTRRAN